MLSVLRLDFSRGKFGLILQESANGDSGALDCRARVE